MIERWKNNRHRKVNAIKRTLEEKRKYHREYYAKHKQFANIEYRLEEKNEGIYSYNKNR